MTTRTTTRMMTDTRWSLNVSHNHSLSVTKNHNNNYAEFLLFWYRYHIVLLNAHVHCNYPIYNVYIVIFCMACHRFVCMQMFLLLRSCNTCWMQYSDSKHYIHISYMTEVGCRLCHCWPLVQCQPIFKLVTLGLTVAQWWHFAKNSCWWPNHEPILGHFWPNNGNVLPTGDVGPMVFCYLGCFPLVKVIRMIM